MNAVSKKVPGKSSKSKIDVAAAKAAICTKLSTPKILMERLGLLDGAKPDGDAIRVRCPGPGHAKGDGDPSLRLDTSPETGRVTAHCFPCGWHGSSPIDIIAAVRLGHWGELRGTDYLGALGEAARVAGVDLGKFATTKGRPRKPLTPELVDQMSTIRSRLLPLESVPDGRTGPYWHAGVAGYLRSRGLDPAKIDTIRHYGPVGGPEKMLAGCLGSDVTLTRGKVLGVVSRREGSWDETGHRLVIPLFGPGGKLAGLVGRATDGVGDPKSVGASGVSPAGAVMANPLAKVALASRDTLTERWMVAREKMPALPPYPRVFICEGEMDWLTVTSHSEAEMSLVFGIRKEAWTVEIAGCVPTQSEVYLLTHSDKPGCDYRDDIAKTLTGRRIFVRHAGGPVEKQPDENDRLLADPAGYSPSAGCVPYETPADEPAKAGKEISIPVDDQLLALATEAKPELIVDQSGEPYLVVQDGPHVTAIPARGEDAETWLRGVWDDVNPSRALRKTSVSTVLETLAARAARKGRRTKVYRRVGRRGTDASTWSIFVDLCDSTGEVIEAEGCGWRIAPRPGCAFARSSAQLPLPRPRKVPEADKPAVWAEFFRLVRVPAERQPQVIAWLLATLIPMGPYPLLVFGGEQGAAKSTAARILRSVSDPSGKKERRAPEDEEAMVVAAKHAWIVDYDNLSSVPAWMSDLLCQFSTGGSYTRRKKFTDTDEICVQFQRPVILAGIPDLATRGDLLDRAIVVNLDPIVKRLGDEEVEASWAALHPAVLGVLLDGVSAFLKNGPATLADPPRLADFYRRAEAAAPAMGLAPGSVVGAHSATQGERVLNALEGDPTFIALDAILDRQIVRDGDDMNEPPRAPMIVGRMADLLERVRKVSRADARIPQGGNGLEGWFRRHGPALRAAGIHSAKGQRSERGQIWKIWRGEATSPPDPAIIL